ncbi:MAG: endonuclease/exonuclease/phosphatase family protein [Candidatus Eremiobacteraeota bacterium]|nr:endonuclease/exonuclease/phosphatase family protein [Candidatus Eremiobacteraeota bacterium]
MIWSLPLLLSLLAPFVSARASWPLALLTLGFPWFYLLALVGLARRRYFSSLGLVLGLFQLPSYFGWHAQRAGSFRILSMNCRYFEAGSVGRSQVHSNIEECKPRLHSIQPDVICSQDYSTSHQDENDQIDDFIRGPMGLNQFIYYLPSMAIHAQTPLLRHHGLIFPSTYNCYCAADLELGGRMVRIYNLHLESYGLGAPGGVLSKLHAGIQMRSEQAEIVAREVATSPYPVILCGDFNDVPSSYVYRKVLGPLQDGFRTAGRGLSFTYQGPLPGLRIDYIFCSSELEFTGYRSVNAGNFFDHRWVVADLRWRP